MLVAFPGDRGGEAPIGTEESGYRDVDCTRRRTTNGSPQISREDRFRLIKGNRLLGVKQCILGYQFA